MPKLELYYSITPTFEVVELNFHAVFIIGPKLGYCI